MSYPTISEYIEALSFAPGIFKKYNNLVPVKDDNGNIIFSSGNFAVVVKMRCLASGNLHAMKLFHRPQDGRINSYEKISNYINTSESGYLVHYDFCINEIEVDGFEYPALVMEWIEGQTLGEYLEELIKEQNKDAICQLASNFDKMALWLLEQPFAHGDLKSDNIMIDEFGNLRLIDYDGMFTPEMAGQRSRENGSPGFRHPGRLPEHFGSWIDDFSILIISLNLSLISYSASSYLNFPLIDQFPVTELSFLKGNNLYSELGDDVLKEFPVASRLIYLRMQVLRKPDTNFKYLYDVLNNSESIILHIRNDIFFSKLNCLIVRTGAFEVGFFNKKKNVIVPPVFSSIGNFCEGLAVAQLQFLSGYINQLGLLIIPFKYEIASDFQNGVAIVSESENHFGLINNEGKQLTEFKYSVIGYFKNGFARVIDAESNKIGYINLKGEEIIEPKYDINSSNNNDLHSSLSISLNGMIGIIDLFGNTIIPIKYRELVNTTYGLIKARLQWQCGYINWKDQIILDFIYDDLICIDYYYHAAKLHNKWGIIDINDRVIFEFILDEVKIGNNLIFVRIAENWGVLSNSGKILVPIRFIQLTMWNDELFLFREEGYWGIYNVMTSKNEIDACFSWVEVLNGQYLGVRLNDRKGIINNLFETTLNFKYDNIEIFHSNMLKVKSKNKYGLISMYGLIEMQIEYDEIKSSSSTPIIVLKDGKWAIFSKLYIQISPFKYDEIRDFFTGFAAVLVDNKWGFINELGEEIVSPKFEGVGNFHGNFATVCINEKWGLINTAGGTIFDCVFNDQIGSFDNDGFAYLGFGKLLKIDGEIISFNKISN